MATPIPTNDARFALGEIALATEGNVLSGGRAAAARGVSTDSRAVRSGDAFVALRGERFDGHDHIPVAIERGASVIVASRRVEVPEGVALVVVEDTLVALGRLGAAHRARWGRLSGLRKIIGITGSAGKTTTKHAIHGCLTALGHGAHASVGNLNNAIGVPMSLFGLGEDHAFGVIEIGMNQPGEIAAAASYAAPDAAVLTLIAEAHTAGVGSIWGVLREKSDLFGALSKDGIAIANADDDLARSALVRAPGRVITYGESKDADVRLVHRGARGLEGSDLRVEIAGALTIEATVPLLGKAGVQATLAAIATTRALGLSHDPASWKAAIATLGKDTQGRLAAKQRPDGAVIIDDAYNANPASMRSSMEAAREIASALDKTLVLVLGAMFELGDRSEELHREIGARAASLSPRALVVVGPQADPIAAAATEKGAPVHRAPDAAAAEALIASLVTPSSVVLVKASNSVGLSRVAARALAE